MQRRIMTKLLKNLMQGASTVFSITPPPAGDLPENFINPIKQLLKLYFQIGSV